MEKQDISIDILVADVSMRLQAMQNLLIKKGLITMEEFQAEIESVSRVIYKSILEKAQVPGDHDKLIDDLSAINKTKIIDN